MTNRTAWTTGNGAGLTWTTAINSSDTAGMAAANSVLSTVADIANGTSLDMFMDISVRLTISSATLAAGTNLAIWLYALLDDGTTYGDNQLVAGTQTTKVPLFGPTTTIALGSTVAVTNIVGYVSQITIPPGSFRLALQNNTSVAISSGTVKYRTYNINLNN